MSCAARRFEDGHLHEQDRHSLGAVSLPKRDWFATKPFSFSNCLPQMHLVRAKILAQV